MAERMGWMTRLRAEQVAEYRAMHAAPWPEILAVLSRAHVTDYTIWLHEPELILFANFLYTGEDFATDMAMVAADPVARRWNALTAACQQVMGADGEAWVALQEVFRLD
jgi:L-rhamnose mutarotase